MCPECGGTRLTRIGADEREVLEYVPSHFKVIVHVRPKMSCRICETISEPPMVDLPIERGRPGPGLVAHVVVSKYADHVPLHRQSVIYAREGVAIERSTMADWVRHAAFLLEPLAEAIGDHVRAGEVLHADDTPVKVLDPGRGQTKTGRLWLAMRDERPWGSSVPPAIYYQYAPDRKGERAEALLSGCRGYLHADAYSGFNSLYERDPADEDAALLPVACWAHARRKLFDEHHSTGSPRALELLEMVGELFAIEGDIKGRPRAERHAIRQEHAVPLLLRLKGQFDATLAAASTKSDLAKAIRYATSRWEAMMRYTTDGRLEISNNAAERAIRPIAVGRKNWIFAGSDEGGKRAAIMYTLIETAKANGLDPEVYLRTVIGRIGAHSIKRVAELLPWNITLQEPPIT
jgi:transposase